MIVCTIIILKIRGMCSHLVNCVVQVFQEHVLITLFTGLNNR